MAQSSIAILRTGLTGYSGDPGADELPEGRALADLRALYRRGAGADMFAAAVRPGDRVVIKPNLVRDWHPDGHSLDAVITSPTVIRAVVDAVYEALDGRGEIIIADAPMGDTDFGRLVEVSGLGRIAEHYRRRHGFAVQIRDLRKYRYRWEPQPGGYGHEVGSELPGDPEGYYEVDLGAASAFAGLAGTHLLEGTDVARRRETIASHSGGSHRYLVAGTVLSADALISVPKLKTHAKVGVTLNCKGMVGINGDKNWLPHFRWGGPAEGGDQFPPASQSALDRGRMRLGRLVADTLIARRGAAWARLLLRAVQLTSGAAARAAGLRPVAPVNGDWPGNDTCWRLPADLMRVALYADRRGRMAAAPQRRFLSVVDGIVGGEGNGPLRPTPRAAGVLVAGPDPLAVDRACARLMGFNEGRIRYLVALGPGGEARVSTNHGPWSDLFAAGPADLLGFAPPERWAEELRLAPGRTAAARG